MEMPSKYGILPAVVGDKYCSPWCGFGCTKAAYDRATSEGAALCQRLGPKWHPVIWENGGWHYKAKCGVFEIYPEYSGSCVHPSWTVHGYSAWIQTTPQFISARHGDPIEAMREALGKMQSLFDAVGATLREANHLMIEEGQE